MSTFNSSMSLMALWVLGMSLAPAVAQYPAMLLVGEEVVRGRVIEIGDGGAMRVVSDGREFELRLINVVLPREGSTLGEAAVSLLRKRLLAEPIEVHVLAQPEARDLAVGYPELKGVDVRLELVEKALARYCPGNAPEPELEALEQAARAKGHGIWGDLGNESVPDCQGAT